MIGQRQSPTWARIMAATGLLWALGAVALSSPAWALEKAAMMRVIDDLESQGQDKARLDKHEVTALERSQLAEFIKRARDAAENEEEEEVDRVLAMIRAQLIYMQAKIDLAAVEADLAKHEKELEALKQQVEAKRTELKQKTTELETYRMQNAKKGETK